MDNLRTVQFNWLRGFVEGRPKPPVAVDDASGSLELTAVDTACGLPPVRLLRCKA